MVSLLELADRAMNMYYQEVPNRQDVFDREDFKFHVAAIYSSLLDKYFQEERNMQRRMGGFANVEIPMAWTIHETIQVKKNEIDAGYYAQTSQDMFTFKYDNFGYGIVRMVQGKPEVEDCNVGTPRNEFIKITVDEAAFLGEGIGPVSTKCFYFVAGVNQINFPRINPLAVTPYYVPVVLGVDDSEVMSDVFAEDCLKGAVGIMLEAKKGTMIIDEANDGNKNLVMNQQVNPNLGKGQ